MCQRNDCNFINHLLGRCKHASQVAEVKKEISTVRQATVSDVKKFNKELRVIIADENIHYVLKKIQEATK